MMVLDASVMVAALTGTGSEGVWARALVGTAPLAAPPVALYPYAPCAERAWELRANVTTHDAWSRSPSCSTRRSPPWTGR